MRSGSPNYKIRCQFFVFFNPVNAMRFHKVVISTHTTMFVAKPNLGVSLPNPNQSANVFRRSSTPVIGQVVLGTETHVLLKVTDE